MGDLAPPRMEEWLELGAVHIDPCIRGKQVVKGALGRSSFKPAVGHHDDELPQGTGMPAGYSVARAQKDKRLRDSTRYRSDKVERRWLGR